MQLAMDEEESSEMKSKSFSQKPTEIVHLESKPGVSSQIQNIEEDMKCSDEMKEVSDGFFLHHDIYNKLYPYQREGVAWMFNLFNMKKGGVLADDMGLGKTFQIIAFLSGLINVDKIKCALIIMPVSLLTNWEKNFNEWCPKISVNLFHGKAKMRNLLRFQSSGHILLTSYGMLRTSLNLLMEFEGKPFIWDYVILDEGHKIKNPNKTTRAVHAIPAQNRLVLTGTPVQNNLLVLWALYDFVHQGALLGSLKTFKMQYKSTIRKARRKDSTAGEKRLGTEMAEKLRMLIKPYFLRRTKAEVWSKDSRTSEEVTGVETEMEQMSISKNLNSRKTEWIVWTFMSNVQSELYRSFLHSDDVKTILSSEILFNTELYLLKKICDHPRLLSQEDCLNHKRNKKEDGLQQRFDDESSYLSSIENVTDEILIKESGKMKFLIQLLEHFRSEGLRTLVFSLSRRILDMINRILINRKWKLLRIDGTVSEIEERTERINLFKKDTSYSVFLLTTQVGGVGITLPAADRVVIYDPSWNPATDAQAVDRVYRIGQENDVIVYRLITCGTVEEKIYRRQVLKDSITKQATGSSDPYRYFSKQDLNEAFTFENPRHSATQVQLSQLHSHERLKDTRLDMHIAFLHSLDIFGISDHDLMFSREIKDASEDNKVALSHDDIKKQVAAAQMLIQTEASVAAEGICLEGTFTRPFFEHAPGPQKISESVEQMSKPLPSTSTASSHFSEEGDKRRTVLISSPELLKNGYDLNVGDQKKKNRTSAISSTCTQISGQSVDDFVQKDINDSIASSDQLPGSDSECSDQENAEQSFIHDQDSKACTNSDESSFVLKTKSLELLSTEAPSPIKRYSLAELRSSASPNGFACSSIADLSFDERPRRKNRPKSVFLSRPVVASDSGSPSKEDASEEDSVIILPSPKEPILSEDDSERIVPSSTPNSSSPSLRFVTLHRPKYRINVHDSFDWDFPFF